MRIRLTTSRPAGYRRGGLIIGDRAAPTVIAKEGVEPSQMLAILSDPNIAIDVSEDDEGDRFAKIDDDDRQGGIESLTAAIAAEAAKVDLSKPPTDDVAQAQAAAEAEAKAKTAAAAKAGPAAEDKKPKGVTKPRVAQPQG